MNPLVTCIVTCYQKIPLLFEAIDSVLFQDYPRIELLIADDCSQGFITDQVAEYIETKKQSNIERYFVFHQKENVGTVRNTNSMIAISNGDYFVGLDGDDVLFDEHVISRIVNRFLNSGADYLACSRLKCDSELNTIGLFPTEEQKEQFESLHTAEEQLAQFAVFNFLEVDAHVFSKRVVTELGQYDERFRQWQDGPRLTEYTKRGNTISAAFDIVYIKYRQGGVSNNHERNAEAFKHIAKDRMTFVEKYTIPNKRYCNRKQYRKTLFWYSLETKRGFRERITIPFLFPMECFELIFNRFFLH